MQNFVRRRSEAGACQFLADFRRGSAFAGQPHDTINVTHRPFEIRDVGHLRPHYLIGLCPKPTLLVSGALRPSHEALVASFTAISEVTGV